MNLFYNIKKFWYAKYVRRLQKYATNLWARNLFCSYLKKYVQKLSDERIFRKWELGFTESFKIFCLEEIKVHRLNKSYSLTISVHLNFKTFSQSARLTLIATCDIYLTIAIFLTSELQVPTNCTFEESTTSVTRVNAVVFSRRFIPAHTACR